ncbi:MAG: hypothetical protein V3W41_09205 [Planctomycetota bacterium]
MSESQDFSDGNPQAVEIDPELLRRAARNHVSTPAIGMIFTGALSIFVMVCFSIVVTTNPDGYVDFVQGLGWANPDEVDLEEEALMKERLREAVSDGPRLWTLAISIIGSLIAIAGGICMKRLKARKFAICAGIVAMIPVFVPCCIGIVFGGWAIMVLLRDDVASVFENG